MYNKLTSSGRDSRAGGRVTRAGSLVRRRMRRARRCEHAHQRTQSAMVRMSIMGQTSYWYAAGMASNSSVYS